MVGVSGIAGDRFALDTASARNTPARVCGRTAGGAPSIESTSLVLSAIAAGPAPLYGTWSTSMSAAALNNSPVR
jgi:hypothetical protein